MPSPTHACPGGCGAEISRAQLSCKPDWFRLPKPLRDEINAAYRRRASDPRRHLTAVRDAAHWYRSHPRGDA